MGAPQSFGLPAPLYRFVIRSGDVERSFSVSHSLNCPKIVQEVLHLTLQWEEAGLAQGGRMGVSEGGI